MVHTTRKKLFQLTNLKVIIKIGRAYALPIFIFYAANKFNKVIEIRLSF